MEILAGLMFGFAGSLHCIGMCGPIVLALPIGRQGLGKLVFGRLLYNLGRVVTYTVMGGIVGLVGSQILLPALQQYLSIIAGILIIASVLLRQFTHLTFPTPSFLSHALSKLQARMALLLKGESMAPLLILGMLNGLLPCGFVYLAMTTAAVTAHVVGGMLFMAGFGLGTIPAMVGFSISPRIISADLRSKLVKILPAFTLLVGILLVVRGLNLGIPFISPKLSGSPPIEMMHRHH